MGSGSGPSVLGIGRSSSSIVAQVNFTGVRGKNTAGQKGGMGDTSGNELIKLGHRDQARNVRDA